MPKFPKSAPEPQRATLADPRERFPKPPFPAQQKVPPGNSRSLQTPRRLRREHLHRPWPPSGARCNHHRC
jgi:hypothetical protein